MTSFVLVVVVVVATVTVGVSPRLSLRRSRRMYVGRYSRYCIGRFLTLTNAAQPKKIQSCRLSACRFKK